MCCTTQKLAIVVAPKLIDSMARVRSSGARSRKPVDSARTTPEAPKPSIAVEITRKLRWCQSATESTRVSASSSRSVANEIRKMPT